MTIVLAAIIGAMIGTILGLAFIAAVLGLTVWIIDRD